MKFRGKVVAISGAAGGVGQELCRHFGENGARVYAIDKRDAVISFVAGLIASGVDAKALHADIGDAEAVASGLGKLIKDFGEVDILINNAGYSHHHSIAKTNPAEWNYDINGNLNGAYNCFYTVLPGMKQKGKGSIITIGSVNGLSALGDPAYSAAKAGLISMTKAIAMECGRFGIRANIVLPGTVRTPIWDERVANDPELLENLIRWYPIKRIVEPIDVSNAVSFLASDEAAAITGIALPVDCGLTAGNIVLSRELTLEDF